MNVKKNKKLLPTTVKIYGLIRAQPEVSGNLKN